MAKALNLVINGKPEGALNAMHRVEVGSGSLGKKLANVGKIMAASLGGAAVGLAAFGVKSAKTYEQIGSDVLLLQRRTGLSAESASKLRFAFQQSGIDAKKGATAIGIFSRKVVSSKDGMKDFGFAVRDSSGHLLPMQTLLDRAADKLHTMKDGAEKNKAAMDLFGRGGLDMIKVMGRGSKGLQELGDEAKKYGLVLTKDNADAVRKSISGHRKMTAAWQGLQVQIGVYVLPILAKVEEWMANKIPQALAAVRRFVIRNRESFQHFRDAVKELGEKLKEMAAKVIDKVKPALAKITEFFQKHPTESLRAFAVVAGGLLAAAFLSWAVSATAAALATAAAMLPIVAVVGAVALVVAALIYAYHHWTGFREVVDKVARFLRDTVLPAIGKVAVFIVENFRKMLEGVRSHWGTVANIVHGVTDKVKSIAKRGFELVKDYVVNPVRSAVDRVTDIVGSIVNLFRNMPTRIGNALSGLASTVAAPFRGIWRAVKDVWNKYVGGKGFDIPTVNIFGHKFGGGSFHIPRLHTGGVVPGVGEVPIMALGGERVLSRSEVQNAVSGTPKIDLHVTLEVDGKAMAYVVRDVAYDVQRTTGRPFIPAVG